MFLVTAFLMASCRRSNNEMASYEYRRFVEAIGNGYHKEVTAGDLIYSVQYKPYEYIAAAEQQWAGDTAVMHRRSQKLAGTVWFNVGIRSKRGTTNPLKETSSDLNDYNTKLTYFLSGAEQQFRLFYNGEPMPCAGYFFENNYGLSPSDVMVVGFKIPDMVPSGDVILEYEDVLYQSGTIKVKINKGALEELRNIKITL